VNGRDLARVALGATLALLTACSPAVAPPASADRVLRIGLHSEPHNLSPIFPQHAEEFLVNRLYSDVLTSFDDRGTMVPMLAAVVPTRANGGISADERTITYQLRRNVRWHDGVPFTSADVAFTWHAIMDARNNVVSHDGYEVVDRVQTPGPYSVRFHLKRRFAPILAELFGDGDTPLGMLPAHLLAKRGELNDVPFNAQPIGTGPYIVRSWLRGDRIELDANPNYFLGAPKIKHITLFFVPDENTLLARVRSHEIDWLPEASPALVPQLGSTSDVRIATVNQNHWFGLWFNLRSPSVRDIDVRRAIAAALDKASLTRTLTYRTAVPATVDIPSFMWAYPRGITTVAYDAALARRSVAALGRRLPALSIAYDQSSSQTRATAVQVQGELAAAGMSVQLHGYRREVFLGAYRDGGITQSGKYEIALARWLYGPDPDNSSEFGCSEIPPNGYNLSRYCTPEMESAQRDALDHVDRVRRKAAYARIEAYVARDLPVIPLWWPKAIHLVTADLLGFAPNGLIATWNAWQWSFAPRASATGVGRS
jgi:peptide/nickel transport system substrate-binding protein